MKQKIEDLTISTKDTEQINIKPKTDIIFQCGDKEMLKLCENGDILVKGKKIKNDLEVYKALKEWIEKNQIFTKHFEEITNFWIQNKHIKKYSIEELEKIRTNITKCPIEFCPILCNNDFDEMLKWIKENPEKVKKILEKK